jgi:hypothetical protein
MQNLPQTLREPISIRARLRVLPFCLAAIAGSHLFFMGADEGIRAIDQQAFDAQVEIAARAKQYAHGTRETTKAHEETTVWAALEKGSK